MAWVWVPRLGKAVWKHRRKITRTVSLEKTRRRATKFVGDRRKQFIGKKQQSQRGLGVVIKRPGRPKSRKTMRARSAKYRRRRAKFLPYRKGGCPPGYRYDPRRKMCIQNNYK